MSNLDTIQAIEANLKAILTTTLDWDLEDLSDNPLVDDTTRTFCELDYGGVAAFEDLFNERPSYIEESFTIRVVANRPTHAARNLEAQTAIHALRGALNVAALNVGALSASKLVSRVAHLGGQVNQDGPLVSVEYTIRVRYRES